MDVIREEITFQHTCKFCNARLNINATDLQTTVLEWNDFPFTPKYWCKCPRCKGKIYISRLEFAFKKLIQKFKSKKRGS